MIPSGSGFNKVPAPLKRVLAYSKQASITSIIMPLLWHSNSYVTDLLDRLAIQVYL